MAGLTQHAARSTQHFVAALPGLCYTRQAVAGVGMHDVLAAALFVCMAGNRRGCRGMGAGAVNGRRAARDATQRVVVTGMGAISPLGTSVAQLWDGVAQGRSGIGPITICTTEGYPTKIAGEASGFDPKCFMDANDARRMSRASQ